MKDKSINGTHAILAWMGFLDNFKKIGESIENPQIRKFVIEMLEEEIKPVILIEYPKIKRKTLILSVMILSKDVTKALMISLSALEQILCASAIKALEFETFRKSRRKIILR